MKNRSSLIIQQCLVSIPKRSAKMSRNRKSFIYVIIIDKDADIISLRVIRIKQNKPVFLGCPGMKNAKAILSGSSLSKKKMMEYRVRQFLISKKDITEDQRVGVDYLLEAV